MSDLPGIAAPPLGEDDFLAALQAYLPRGAAWPREPDALLTQFLRGAAKAQARLHARQNQLLIDAFPATTEELLPEWEASLGLPDPCIGPEPLDSERQKLVVARLTALGGQSIAYFTAVALALGFTITVREYALARFGMRFGGRFYGHHRPDVFRFGTPPFGRRFAYPPRSWAYVWQVDTAALHRNFFRFGIDRFGEPFSDWSDAPVLRCEFARLKPAHTQLVFAYS